MNRARGWASPQRHRPVRRRPLVQLLSLICVAAVLGLTGCGSTGAASISTSAPPSTPAEIATPTPTVDPADAAILNAYDQAVTAWSAAAADPGAQNPGIVEWYAGQALTLAQARLAALQQLGWVVLGTYTPHPIVTNLDGSTATVQDCGWNSIYVADEGTTTAVSPQPASAMLPFDETVAARVPAGWDNVTATMVLQSGTWQLSEQLLEVTTPCTAASPSA